MYTSNWRPTQGASAAAGDWRAQLQRQKIVNKIMDTLKRYLPFTGYERLQELKKIAERVEQEIYTAATSQSEYSRKTCFMILTMETRLESPVSEPVQSNSAANAVHTSVPFDWQEEVYQKINAMKDLYHLDWRAPLRADSRQRIVNKIFDTLKRHVPLFGDEGLEELMKIAERFEGKMYTAATSQSDYLCRISLKMLSVETRSQNPLSDHTQSNFASNSVNPSVLLDFTAQTVDINGGDGQEEVYQKPGKLQQQQQMDAANMLQRYMQQRLATAGGFQQQNAIDMQERLCPQKRAKPEPSSIASSDSTTPTGNPNGRDWQEEVYRKIEATDMHLDVSRPIQGASSAVGDPTMESGDWRAQLPADSRQRITNRIMDTMKRRLPSSIQEINKIAERLEGKMYTAAISQSDYIKKISWKLVNFETKYPMQSTSAAAANSVKPLTSRNEL